ncbi:MAG: hypothetical protein AB7O24_17065 [Kofleriaceae bacterium]
MSRPTSRSLATALAASGVLALGACSKPEQLTDLRPAGPPEVLTVMVMNDPDSLLVETATFCKLNDDKRPVEVGLIDLSLETVCSPDPTVGADMVEDAVPYAWYVRVVFDELLDPAIETLTPVTGDGDCNTDDPTQRPVCVGSIKDQNPVTLTCGGVAVPYDGYYSPGGNYVTWPVGPGLVIVPDDPTSVATSTDCQLTLTEAVKDKDGVAVPPEQRGPFAFKIAPFALESTSPTSILAGATKPKIAPEAPVTLTFNTVVDPASLDTTEVRIFKGVNADCTGGTQVPMGNVVLFQMLDDSPPDGVVDDERSIMIADSSAMNANPTPADPEAMGLMFDASTAYRIEIDANATASDIAGGSGPVVLRTVLDSNDQPQPTTLCFETNMATP